MRLIAIFCVFLGTVAIAQTSEIFVPAGGNAWTNNGRINETNGRAISGSETAVSRFYVRLRPGELQVALSGKVNEASRALVSIQSASKEVELIPGAERHPVGVWRIDAERYLEISIAGKISNVLDGLVLSGSAIDETNAYVRNNEGNFFYWGRRGPSVHLRFDLTDQKDIEWFYSEITVPTGNDIIGSYYMANGFADGYFGFQVNSETERRVLFSVWSPFKTDDPRSIPEEDKIILMKKGEGVYTGEFGNEGSGGQSFLRYPWKAGSPYGFLLRGKPEGPNTIYTAWFIAPEEGKWKLIASWRRPKKATYLTSLYSFLENFIPETGTVERRANFGNQWVRDKEGKWIELTRAKFTGDNTARKNYRKDYGGGVSGDSFYLRNCGFFSDFTPLDQSFTRPLTGKFPVIDFDKLP